MTCKCGYEGHEWSMAFDVQEAYDQLRREGLVYTVRPVTPNSPIEAVCHVHRNHRWTGEMVRKELVRSDSGKPSLLEAMYSYVHMSGFNHVDEWYAKLVEMHGEKVTSNRWGIYRVVII